MANALATIDPALKSKSLSERLPFAEDVIEARKVKDWKPWTTIADIITVYSQQDNG